MSIGSKLLELRKSKNLSQEEVADKLNVTRQTISKWETDQSTPDFDKISLLCDLYGISADELLNNRKTEKVYNEKDISIDKSSIRKKNAIGISRGVLIYFVAVAWIIVSIAALKINPIISTGIFLLICGIATYLIIYTSIVYKTEKVEEEPKEKSIVKELIVIIETITLIIYLFISFITMAWYITWIIWIIGSLVVIIVKLIFSLRGENNEK